MLRDDTGGGGRKPSRNVLGQPLASCSSDPLTGFFRNGCCDTAAEDVGSHTVCIIVTEAFLAFSKSRGNDLSTPLPAYGFPGLKEGDQVIVGPFSSVRELADGAAVKIEDASRSTTKKS